MSNRYCVYIDGFNLYHVLDNNPNFHQYKWLDYKKLAQCFIGSKDSLEKVYYFTALATWDHDKLKRHKDFVSIQRSLGVEIVLGRFKRVTKKCRKCGEKYRTFEEKHTDVNIAIRMIRDAEMDLYDKAILISADSDLVSPIHEIHTAYPDKVIVSVPPIHVNAVELPQICDERIRMNENHLKRSVLPNEIHIKGKTITRPSTWMPPVPDASEQLDIPNINE